MQQQSSIKYTCAATVWTLVVLLALFLPARAIDAPESLSIPGLDKAVHFILFAILTFLIAMALRERGISYKAWMLCLILGLFGLSTELIQTLIEDRNGDILDFGADMAGVVIALLIIKH